MSEISFQIPRQSDLQIIEALRSVAEQSALSGPLLYVYPFEGANSKTVPFSNYAEDEVLKSILPLHQASIHAFNLQFNPNGQTHTIIGIKRVNKSLFDECRAIWNERRDTLTDAAYVRIVALAKQVLKEVKVDEACSGMPDQQLKGFLEAQVAGASRLQNVNEELLFGIHERQKKLDDDFQKKGSDLVAKFERKTEELQKQHEEKQKALEEKEANFKQRQEQFETRESKYLRRQLSKDMLKILDNFKTKFELTESTRALRRPIHAFLVFLIFVFGGLMVLGFYQTYELLKGLDPAKVNWVAVGFVSLKQAGFTAAFIAAAWFYVKWNDKWFRQHADSEFMFKRLELDITRANWVVEMAMEWKAEKGTEIPTELLDRLTRNLFKEDHGGKDGEAPPTIADAILGSAAALKVKAGGTEIDFDRKGLQKALKSGSENR